MPDYDGNTVATARNIGTLTATTQTFSDWVGSTDTNDYYRFTTTGTSNLRLNLTGMTADADVMVYAANGITVIGISAAGGSANETVNINNLAAGTYYVRVYPYGGSTYYNLSLAALPVAPTDNAGNTLATARNIGTLTSTTQTFSDAVGSTDANDYYRFTTTSTSNLRLNLTGMSAAADVKVYAANGTTVVGSGTACGNANETVNIDNLAAGTYYVRVYPYGGSTNYNLSLAALPISSTVDDFTANTSTTGQVAVGSSATGVINSAGDQDWFRVNLTAGQQVVVNMEGNTLGDTYIRGIYNSSGTLLPNTANDDNGTSLDSRVTFTAASAGTYYVAAGGLGSSTGTYRLGVSGASTPPPILPPTSNQYQFY